MPTEITPGQLDTICNSAISAYLPNQPLLFSIILTLYNTGLRCNEVLEVERWSYIDFNNRQVQLEKGQATRVIPNTQIGAELLSYYDNQQDLGVYTYSSVNYSIAKATPVVKFGNNVNRTITHMFRYNFIKQLGENGLTISQIKSVTKQTSSETVEHYLNDIIYLYP